MKICGICLSVPGLLHLMSSMYVTANDKFSYFWMGERDSEKLVESIDQKS
jgi:hypothetical protein